MSQAVEHHVSIGEVKIARGSEVLKATLGSCVGIAFIWKQRGVSGLAHCLLAEGPATELITARYVTQAIPSLIRLMDILPSNHREIDAVVVGGGNMTAISNAKPETLVGALNARAAESLLSKLGFTVIHRDVGGDVGRQIRVLNETGEFNVISLPRIVTDAS